MRAGRTGFTVVDVLVAISVAGLLLAIVFPAVQAAREASRRNACKNHLRQVALAVGSHESAQRRFPANGWGFQWYGDPDRGTAKDQPGGWIYNILGFLEHRDLALLGAGQSDAAKRHFAALANQRVVDLFYCPSRRPAAQYLFDAAYPPRNADLVAQTAKTDYAINAGDTFIPAGGGPQSYQEAADPNFAWPNFSRATGVSFLRSTVTLAQVRDGTSLTYLIGEKSASATGNDPGDDQGWLVGYDLDNSRWALRGGAPVPDARGPAPTSFGSAHPGVCQFMMCDGSGRDISFSIDPLVYRRLGNRQDGEVVDEGSF